MQLSAVNNCLKQYEIFVTHCRGPSDLQNDPHKAAVRVILTRTF